MKKLRETVNKNEDTLVYNDEDYLIYKKCGEITGTILAPLDLVHIGLEGLKSDDNPTVFKYKDYREIILKIVTELEDTIEKYPKD